VSLPQEANMARVIAQCARHAAPAIAPAIAPTPALTDMASQLRRGD
jgi:hypothetical protein